MVAESQYNGDKPATVDLWSIGVCMEGLSVLRVRLFHGLEFFVERGVGLVEGCQPLFDDAGDS